MEIRFVWKEKKGGCRETELYILSDFLVDNIQNCYLRGIIPFQYDTLVCLMISEFSNNSVWYLKMFNNCVQQLIGLWREEKFDDPLRFLLALSVSNIVPCLS